MKSVQRDMQFNRIGKLTPKFVALESIDVTVELSSPGKLLNLNMHNSI